MTAPTVENLRARLSQLQEGSGTEPEIAEVRLALLRAEMPQALVQVDSVRADDTAIAIKVTIGLPGGARHSHISAADVEADANWADQLAMVQAEAVLRVLDGLSIPAAGAPRETTAPASPAPTPRKHAQGGVAEEDHLPEYSWNAFWQSMNSRQITREQVEQALGKSVQEATPKEAVDALTAAGILSKS